MLLIIISQFFASLTPTETKTVDNKLTETPTVTCGPEMITIEGRTEEPFEGAVFIKNWRRKDGCATNYDLKDNNTSPSFSISLNRISDCGLELRRNAGTKELEIFSVFVFSFHPNFVTAGDRSFAVHCIFLEDTIKVATKFNFIADISTRGIIGGTAEVPVIDLTIVRGRVPDPNLEPATVVSVGEPLMYIWYINHDTEIYGIRVKECSVETENGRKLKIIEEGCSLDPSIVSHVQYSENNLKGFADGSAFKFPDADNIWIMCAVTTCYRKSDRFITKDTNDTKHFCPKPISCSRRETRSTGKESGLTEIYSTDDLVDHKLHVIDRPAQALPYRDNINEQPLEFPAKTFCVNKYLFAGTSAALLTAYLATLTVAGGFGLSVYRSQYQK